MGKKNIISASDDTTFKLKALAKEKGSVRRKLFEHVKELEQTRSAILNILEDLHAEKEALVDARVKNEALLESIGEGVVAVDQDGKIILINRMAEQMLGLSAGQVIGKLIGEAWKTSDAKGNLVPAAERPIEVALREKTITTSSFYFYTRKNGTTFPVAITVTPVIVNNKTIGAIDVFRDIAKEKEIERMRMDFLSLASHQLRTPLSGTKWLIETMRGGTIGKITRKEKEYFDDIYKINEQMIKLVSDILSTLRLESEAVPIKKEKIEISSLFKDILIGVTAAAEEKKIVLQSPLSHQTLTIETDLAILKSILGCFLSNAVNYSMPGQKVILDVQEKLRAVVFFVRDFGIGIPKDEQKRILERFYRASNAKNLRPSGTGLGLNIAKMLAEKIGAKISFESQENKGSTFCLSIPRGLNEGAEARSSRSKN